MIWIAERIDLLLIWGNLDRFAMNYFICTGLEEGLVINKLIKIDEIASKYKNSMFFWMLPVRWDKNERKIPLKVHVFKVDDW